MKDSKKYMSKHVENLKSIKKNGKKCLVNLVITTNNSHKLTSKPTPIKHNINNPKKQLKNATNSQLNELKEQLKRNLKTKHLLTKILQKIKI
jgi:hypothetical protein